MARIRTIKPEFFRHGGLFDAEQETGLPLRVAFAGLWTAADREGRFAWKPRELKLDALPHDLCDFALVLDALRTRGHIVKYATSEGVFGFIPSWHEHQVINNREGQSTLPVPTEEAIAAANGTPSVTREARVNHASPKQREDGSLVSSRPGFVYVALARAAGAFKVGFAERDPEQRVRDLTTGSPEPLEFVEAIEAEKSLESTIHAALRAYAVHGEWFTICDGSSAVLDAWFTRAPRVAHAGKAEGKGREGNGKEGEGDSPPASPPSPKEPRKPTAETWTAYAAAYELRYGVEPVRNATVNGQLAQFVSRVGAEEAPDVAAFYVNHGNALYRNAQHPVNLLLRDAESLRTQWATGRKVGDASSTRESRVADESAAKAERVRERLRQDRLQEAQIATRGAVMPAAALLENDHG